MFFLPESFLTVSILLCLVTGLFIKQAFQKIYPMALMVVAVTLLFVYKFSAGNYLIFYGLYVSDPFSFFCKIFILLWTFYILLMIKPYLLSVKTTIFEWPILILTTTLGLMLLVSSYDFLNGFIAMELAALSLYIVVSHHSEKEASLKYFILSVFASAFILYGISWLYGALGSTNFETIERFFKSTPNDHGVYYVLGFLCIIVGLAFKLSLAPFHLWAPDVYSGISLATLTYIMTVPKFAIFAFWLRLNTGPFHHLIKEWSVIICLLSALSMMVGGTGPLRQTSMKRFITLSAVGQLGFALLGMSVLTEEGYVHTLRFLMIYITSFLGFMGCLLHFAAKGYEINTIKDLNGIGLYHPIMATFLAFFILCMSGLPPFAGFIPKLLILQNTMHHEYYSMAIVATLYSILAVSYYLWLIKAIFMDDSTHNQTTLMEVQTAKSQCALSLIVIFILSIVTIFPDFLMGWIYSTVSMLVYF